MKTHILFVSLFITLTSGCASAQSRPAHMIYGRVAPMLAATEARDACTAKAAPRTVGRPLPSECRASTAMATGRGTFYLAKAKTGVRALGLARSSLRE